MAIFDLHCHPSFKSALLNRDLNQCPTPVAPVDIKIGFLSEFIEGIFGDSLDSQSSFEQIPGGSLVVANLIAFERAYSLIDLIRAIRSLDKTILNDTRDEASSYFQGMFDRDFAHLKQFNDTKSNLRRYLILQSIQEYPAVPDPETVYVLLGVEGGHNFYKEKSLEAQETNPDQAVRQLEEWKQHSADFPRLLYITLTHHGQNPLTNHAWAIPILFVSAKADKIPHGSFTPTGNGLTDAGRAFIRVALRTDNNEKRILIDVKHMSLKARQEFYRIRQAEFPDAPILATHMGITGTSWDFPSIQTIEPSREHPKSLFVTLNEMRGFLRSRNNQIDMSLNDDLVGIHFNPWSINLFDEDIIQIMRTGGLIGISVDRRICGAKPNQIERFSREEFPVEWLQTVGKAPINNSLYPNQPLPKQFDGNVGAKIEDRWHFC